ncbi:MAG: diguanylate cyclase [Acidobacteriota bacterium]|nr:diguanylate cyclase [Acidobacteriota bacterium]
MTDSDVPGDSVGPPTATALRQQVAALLLDRLEVIVNDTVALFPFSGPQQLDSDYCARLGRLVLQLLASAIHDGRIDSRTGFAVELLRTLRERTVSAERFFAFTYLIERTALDELALDDSVGATTEPWPLAAQLVRRASFDVLAAYADRTQQEPGDAAITDRLTTLYTRPVLETVLLKELERACRFGYPLALMMFDIDRLADINQDYGYGVGDRILERLGILVRTYFRELDWVARYREDAIVVVLPHTRARDAAELAERLRASVEERLGFRDHRNNRRVRVTVSVGLLTLQVEPGDPTDVDRVFTELEGVLERAKQAGRNTVQTVHVGPASYAVSDAARVLNCTPAAVRRLVASGELPAFRAGRQLRLDRAAVDAYRKPIAEGAG